MALAGTASIFRLASRRAAGNGASLSRMFSHSARRQFPVGKSNLNPRDEVVVRTWWQDLFYYSILVPKGKICRTSEIIQRMIFLWGVTGVMVGYMSWWYTLHYKWPAMEKELEREHDLLNEEEREVAKNYVYTPPSTK